MKKVYAVSVPRWYDGNIAELVSEALEYWTDIGKPDIEIPFEVDPALWRYTSVRLDWNERYSPKVLLKWYCVERDVRYGVLYHLKRLLELLADTDLYAEVTSEIIKYLNSRNGD